jgi:hypothetical protein
MTFMTNLTILIFHLLSRMKLTAWVILIVTFSSCQSSKKIQVPGRKSSLTGHDFYQQAFPMKWAARDSFVLAEINAGNIPTFLERFVPVKTSITDSPTGKIIQAIYYVAPDYLSVGTDKDWARVHITPYAAQRIADTLNCFLPTRKIVDDIYRAAKVKLEPVPLYAFRDSTPIMWHHHLIVEGQRKGKKGLIAGIQKDVVISGRISRDSRPDRVAIYGWHKPDGKPIQPLYTGHIYWWVDYSQGIRLVYRQIRVNGKWMDYIQVLQDPLLRKLLCDESDCDYYRYPVNK